MSTRARLLVLEDHPDAAVNSLWSELRGDGFDVVSASLPNGAAALRRGQRPDVLILNLLAAEARDAYTDLAAEIAVSTGTRDMPILALSEQGADKPFGVTESIAGSLAPARIGARAATLARLAVMHREVLRRTETAALYGLDAELYRPDMTAAEPEVLMCGAGTRFLAVEAALSGEMTLVGALSVAAAVDYCGRRDFDVLLVDQPVEATRDFVERLRRDPRFTALPVIALGIAEADAAGLFAVGVTDVVPDPVDPRDLVRRTRAFAAEQQLRRSLTRVYAQARRALTNDALTGLYAHGFFMEHLERLIHETAADGDRFAVAGFRVVDLAGVNEEHGYVAGDRVIRQIGSLIANTVRGEDLAARVGGDRFAVILNGTGSDGALVAARRLAATVRTTTLALSPGKGLAVDCAMAVVESEPGEKAAALIERLFRDV